MTDTENRIFRFKSEHLNRVASAFLLFFISTAVSFAAAYLYFLVFGSAGKYAALEQPGKLSYVLISQLPQVLESAVLFAAVFTVCCRNIGVLLCVFRGAGFGLAAYMIGNGDLVGVSDRWAWALGTYFLSTLAFVLLASLTSIYSGAICTTHAAHETTEKHALVIEYTKIFLCISGAIFIFGSTTVLLI